jgi:tRNA threonylcarbamoyladenosine biosynthesis protein TsaB
MTPETLILAVETSSRTGSVALALGEKLLAETSFSGPTRHSAEVLPAIQQLMQRFGRKPHEIGQVHISIGPGSFTGLRIATTLAKTIHLANGAKIIPVDTLDVIAANVIDTSMLDARCSMPDEYPVSSIQYRVAAILDAKRNQFFVAVYEYTSAAIWKKAVPDSLMTAAQFVEEFARSDKPIWLLGDGLLYYKDRFSAEGIRFLDEKYWSPRARNVHLLGWQKALAGQFADPLTLQPAYLRKPDVTRKKDSNSKCKM